VTHLMLALCRVLAALALVVALAACERPEAAGGTVVHSRFGLAEIVSLDIYRDGGRLHMLLAGPETPGGERVLRYVRSGDAGRSWSEPVPLGAGQPAPVPVKRGNDVQIAAHGDRLFALWQTEGSGFAGAGPMVAAVSRDGGKSWRAGPNPAADDSRDGHAFADLAADATGTFHLVWLDSRGVVLAEDGTKRVAAAGAGRQGLMYARSADGGRSWTAHRRIDAGTCECCWNSLHAAGDGALYVLYRDIDPRDMALAVSADGGGRWRREGTVGAFGWDFDGCPHVGGALAVAADTGGGRDRMIATVWTGKADAAGLYALETAGPEAGWSAPALLGEQARHSDVAALPDGGALAVWDAYLESGPAVMLARRPADDSRWSEPRRLSASGARASHPRVAVDETAATVVWTELREIDGEARATAAIVVLPLRRNAS